MIAISLWQPWATAIALGSKRVETRSWSTNYRGPLAIHAAKRRVKSEFEDEYEGDGTWQGALHLPGNAGKIIETIPFGAIVAVCTLADCRRSESFRLENLQELRFPPFAPDDRYYAWSEEMMGNFAPGRYGWVLDNIRALEEPVPFKGSQGFFEVPNELLGVG